MSADLLLSRLQRVKKVGPGKWTARCPTREDRSPSLSICELADGRVLVHDFGGADVESIMNAVGLSVSDLFPDTGSTSMKAVKRPFIAADLIELAAFESSVAAVVSSDVAHGRVVSESDHERLRIAAQRLADAARACRAYR
jgi:hypothetical protein